MGSTGGTGHRSEEKRWWRHMIWHTGNSNPYWTEYSNLPGFLSCYEVPVSPTPRQGIQ